MGLFEIDVETAFFFYYLCLHSANMSRFSTNRSNLLYVISPRNAQSCHSTLSFPAYTFVAVNFSVENLRFAFVVSKHFSIIVLAENWVEVWNFEWIENPTEKKLSEFEWKKRTSFSQSKTRSHFWVLTETKQTENWGTNIQGVLW